MSVADRMAIFEHGMVRQVDAPEVIRSANLALCRLHHRLAADEFRAG